MTINFVVVQTVIKHRHAALCHIQLSMPTWMICLFGLNFASLEINICSVFINMFSLSLDIYLACNTSCWLTIVILLYLDALVLIIERMER